MKNYLPFFSLLFFCLLYLPFIVYSQNIVSGILDAPVEDIPAYDTTCVDCIYLQVEYGTSNFLNLDVLTRFSGEVITQVDMVYSSFARTKGFDQIALNRERLENLQKVAPQLFENELIDWTLIRQTACASLEESERLFHGFVVHLAPGTAIRDKSGKLEPVKPSEETAVPSKKPGLKTRDTVIIERRITTIKLTDRNCEETGKYLPRNKTKAKNGTRYDNERAGLFWKRKPEKVCTTTNLGYRYDTSYVRRTYKVNVATGKLMDRSLIVNRANDTVVVGAMERNWDTWKKEKLVIVQDMTGSMTSYLSQIVQWREQYASKGVEDFVFFNDGDSKPNSQKEIGKTGGIYYINSRKISEIQEVAYRCSDAGYGGDTQENNVEALLQAQDKCSNCTQIVMIADNYAPVRDISLLDKVKKPVHVIVCGGNGEVVHSHYLTIGAMTGGSIHTSSLDLDLKNAAKSEDPLVIGERKYVLKNGLYELVRE